MKPTPFNQEKDIAPLPFNQRLCHLAREMKALGLSWTPHVGCFVWDPDKHIEADSPLPERIYFILSMPRFLRIFGDIDRMIQTLVWLPTWHQARLLCDSMQIDSDKILDLWKSDAFPRPGDELEKIYRILIRFLRK